MEATFSGWFLGPYKVSKIGYGLFSYALQPAKYTSASFMGAILEEYLVHYAASAAAAINPFLVEKKCPLPLFLF